MGWIYKNKEVLEAPHGYIGFIYLVENLDKNKFYIGRKMFYSVTNPEISKKKYDELKAQGEPVRKTKNKQKSRKGNVVWRYKRRELKKETNWRTYCGSSDKLNRDIKSGDRIRKTILRYCETKIEMTYRELEQIVKADCLDTCDCYNENVLSKFFSFKKCE